MSSHVPTIRRNADGSFYGAVCVAAFAVLGLAARAAELNDTGQSQCYGTDGAVVSCSVAGMDGRYGRDAAAAAGQLTKTGAGAAGFDYTKIANNGTTLPASAGFGTAPTAWACTFDNVTGLMWEVKVSGSTNLRYYGHTYTWYSTAANNGGNNGFVGTNTCNGTLSDYLSRCNTTNYVSAVNAAGLCGHSDWRMPTVKELLSLTNTGQDNPSIDAGYFPYTPNIGYWTATNSAEDPTAAWFINFSDGHAHNLYPKTAAINVRLVRSGR